MEADEVCSQLAAHPHLANKALAVA